MFVEVPATAERAGPADAAHPGDLDRLVTVRRFPAGRFARGLTPYLYLLPAVVLLIVWIYKPLAETVGL
ncbi:sugar ABC transporter permease, partial [Rhodococcus sp. T2V]|nr:sugar ABC transporter permease [Rhodococcus sp. T2V]